MAQIPFNHFLFYSHIVAVLPGHFYDFHPSSCIIYTTRSAALASLPQLEENRYSKEQCNLLLMDLNWDFWNLPNLNPNAPLGFKPRPFPDKVEQKTSVKVEVSEKNVKTMLGDNGGSTGSRQTSLLQKNTCSLLLYHWFFYFILFWERGLLS